MTVHGWAPFPPVAHWPRPRLVLATALIAAIWLAAPILASLAPVSSPAAPFPWGGVGDSTGAGHDSQESDR